MNYLKKSSILKIHLATAINVVFHRETHEKHVMHSKSDNIEIMIYDKANEVIKEIF